MEGRDRSNSSQLKFFYNILFYTLPSLFKTSNKGLSSVPALYKSPIESSIPSKIQEQRFSL